MLIEDLNHTIDTWIKELEHYNSAQLCTKPSAASWSIGQVYMHLINDTNYYIGQIKICLSNNDNMFEEASPFAQTMFRNNNFPDEILEGDPANADMPQPETKEELVNGLKNIKRESNRLSTLISESRFKGKTKHPGLDYFSAKEWLQFADMHFRHHLRQKKRIDDFLKINIL